MPKPNSPSADGKIRLNKYIALAGLASRRKADELILSGAVKINGTVVKNLGEKVDPRKDLVKINNRSIRPQTTNETFIFNKPTRVLTTMSDPEGRPTVAEYIHKAKIPGRVFPVGRLDWDSEGLLLITSDGDLAQKITHPQFEIPKTYLAKIRGQLAPEALKKLTSGVSIIGGKAKALRVSRVPSRGKDSNHWISITIAEGRNRQIRRMFEKVGTDVLKLQRVAIGQLRLGSLKKGEFKRLTDDEVSRIFLRREDETLTAKPKRATSPKRPKKKSATASKKSLEYKEKASKKRQD